MKRIFQVFPFVFALCIAFSCDTKRTGDNEDSNEQAEEMNKDKFESKDTRKDADFVADAVAANYAELQMAKLATQKSTHNEVKKVAKMIEAEHSKTLEELKSLASQKAISVPAEPEDDDKRKVENLREEKNASDFNKEWAKEMVDKHEEIIEDFEDRLERTEDADLKAWINKKLPGMRSHLEQLRACQDKVKDA